MGLLARVARAVARRLGLDVRRLVDDRILHKTYPTTTVDALAERYDLRPDLVKVDVEGAEALVLAGACETARGRRARFLVEMHHTPELSMAENAAKVLDWCGDVAYTAWYLKEKSALESADPIAGRGRCHLLLLPEEMPFPEYLRPLEQGAEPSEVDPELVPRSASKDRGSKGDRTPNGA